VSRECTLLSPQDHLLRVGARNGLSAVSRYLYSKSNCCWTLLDHGWTRGLRECVTSAAAAAANDDQLLAVTLSLALPVYATLPRRGVCE